MTATAITAPNSGMGISEALPNIMPPKPSNTVTIKAKIHFLAILITYSIRFKSILSNDFMVSISICPGAVTSRPAAKVIGESNLEAITLV